MNTFVKLVKSLLEAGIASAEDKTKAEKLFEELDEDAKELASDKLEKVKALPEEEEEEEEEEVDDEEVEKNLKALIKGATKEVTSELKEEWKKELEEYKQKMKDSQEKKSGIYNEQVQEKRTHLNKVFKETVNAVYANDSGKLKDLADVATTKELTTDSDSTPFGGYVVDTELMAEIHHLITEYGVARREMSVVRLSKNQIDANNLATDVSTFWVDEGSQVDSTQVVLGQESLTLKKLGAIVTLTSELIQDQEIDLFDFVGGRIAEGFAKAEDDAFFKGDGTSTYGSFTGILEADDVNTTTLATGDTAFSDITAEKLLDMQDDTPQGALANGKYYMHRSVLNLIRKLRADAASADDSAGEFLYQAPGENQPLLLWNKPVVLVESMPSTDDSAADTGFVIYGDLRRGAILGHKGAVAVKRFDAGVVRNVADDGDINLITTDREAVRWTERVGYIRIVPTAMTVLKTSAT